MFSRVQLMNIINNELMNFFSAFFALWAYGYRNQLGIFEFLGPHHSWFFSTVLFLSLTNYPFFITALHLKGEFKYHINRNINTFIFCAPFFFYLNFFFGLYTTRRTLLKSIKSKKAWSTRFHTKVEAQKNNLKRVV